MTKGKGTTWLTTGVLVAVALLAGGFIWHNYFNGLWTRDARVVARVIQVAPDVAGNLVDVPVREGQKVEKGQLLFQIDPERYQLTLREAEATLTQSQTELLLQQKEMVRRQHLGKNVSRESLDQAQAALANAQAASAVAATQLAMAKLNLARTRIVAPVAGSISRLEDYAGGYAQVGQPVVTLVEGASFWVEAYFKETQVHRIRVGDKARIHLLGVGKQLVGRVEQIGPGIANDNQQPGNQGLPVVTPSFDWVRLAQRIPVEIRLIDPPANLLLSAGMTASVAVSP